MTQHKNAVAFLLNEYLKFIRKLDDGDLAKILDGTCKIEFTFYEKGKKRGVSGRAKKTLEEADLQNIASALRQAVTREDGLGLLKKEILKKADLQAIARLIDLPFQSRHTKDELTNKIIEGTIGFRLRSKAIREIEL